MKTLKLNRKGVSPIIATLLLIVIAVAAAVVTYSFVMGFLTPGGTTTPQGILALDTPATATTTSITAYVRNTGSACTISSVYLNNTLNIPTVAGAATIFNAGLTTLNLTYGSAIASGPATVKIVCTDTTQLIFTVTIP
jgi:flagellin-like protein